MRPYMWFSLSTTRLTTSSMVRGCSGTNAAFFWPAASSASAAAPPTAKNKSAKTNLRILLLPSVGQTKFNANASRVVHRLALAQSRLEFDLLRGLRSRLIESVSQTVHHAVYLHMSAGQKDHVQRDVAFQFQATPFGGVLRFRFVQDGNRGVRGSVVAGFFLRSFRD